MLGTHGIPFVQRLVSVKKRRIICEGPITYGAFLFGYHGTNMTEMLTEYYRGARQGRPLQGRANRQRYGIFHRRLYLFER